MKKLLKGGVIAAAAVLCIYWQALCAGSLLNLLLGSTPYVTTSIEQYGVFTGNYDNETPAEFITSFFPSSVDDFSDVTYYYRAQKPDSYACEAVLEFYIDDEEQFDAYYQQLAKKGEPEAFPYDSRYDMWTVDNLIWLDKGHNGSPTWYTDRAKVGLILCDKERGHFCYAAIMAYDGGAATAEDLGYFFRKFDIDPVEFARANNGVVYEN